MNKYTAILDYGFKIKGHSKPMNQEEMLVYLMKLLTAKPGQRMFTAACMIERIRVCLFT